MSEFKIGRQYTRDEIFRIIGLEEIPTGGNWFTGYNEYGGRFFVFCNIGVSGRTGHDYANKFEGEELLWYAKTGTHLGQPQMKRLLGQERLVLIFWRADDMAPFTYQGEASPVQVKDGHEGSPVFVRWTFESPEEHSGIRLPEEVVQSERYPEGVRKQITVNAYERQPAARRACLDHWGFDCQVCRFNFKEAYGEIGERFIHVHHMTPLAEVQDGYEVDPIEDLIPVCPNCHAMLHLPSQVMAVEELRQLLVRRT